MARRRRVDPEQKAPKGPLPKGSRKGVIWRDPAYYEVLSNPEMIVALVALVLGESRAREVDPQKLQYQPTRHVGDNLEQRYADLLVRIRYKRPADGGAPRPDTYFLVEFQSTVDPFMAVRLWGQLALVYRGLTLKRRSLGRKRLAAIVPIVSCGQRPPIPSANPGLPVTSWSTSNPVPNFHGPLGVSGAK